MGVNAHLVDPAEVVRFTELHSLVWMAKRHAIRPQ